MNCDTYTVGDVKHFLAEKKNSGEAMNNPNPNLIDSYLKKWDSVEKYTSQDECLGLLFNKFCPENTTLDNVLLKVAALNQLYKTSIFDTYSVAKHILKMDIDQRLKNRDYLLVNELALITIKEKQKNFYSFASKYCSHHVPDAFPVYDYFIQKMLLYFAHTDSFTSFKKADLKKYESFVQIIMAFQKFYGLEKFSLKQIDIFLWLAGREMFPRKPPKKAEK
jgi:hypothetical protein